MKIFSGNSNKPLAEKIVKYLNQKLSPLEIFIFPDGEKRITIKEKVVDVDCVIIQSANTPVDANFMELFITADGLKRSGAKSVKAVIPYFGYQRQDHIFRQGEAVSLQVIIEMLESAGVTEVFSFDFHSIKIPEFFKVPVHHLSALPLFTQKIKKDFDLSKIVLVTPDMGGIRRIKEMSEILGGVSNASVVKNRDLNTGSINNSGLEGSVKGKIAVMVDDMISTGNTMKEAADLLLGNGAIKVYAFATHAVFSKEAVGILENSKIEKVFVTDTIDLSKDKKFQKLEILSIAEIAAKALKNF